MEKEMFIVEFDENSGCHKYLYNALYRMDGVEGWFEKNPTAGVTLVWGRGNVILRAGMSKDAFNWIMKAEIESERLGEFIDKNPRSINRGWRSQQINEICLVF